MSCSSPSAVNYDPTAIGEDGTCIYLTKLEGICYAFQDVNPAQIVDQSFTMSWEVKSSNWVFYHDYVPDFYVMTREHLHNIRGGKIYRHNEGPYGNYYGTVNPFLVDVAFPSKQEFMLNTVQWITSVIDTATKAKEQMTLTHITCWNNYQCSGRVALSSVFELLEYRTDRKTRGLWSFNDFRNVMLNADANFLDTIFKNFAILPGAIDPNPAWYNQQLLQDNFVVIRFEFDNLSNQKLLLHDVEINADKSPR